MTNPTSNYAWQMPTPTDLVTDLPADFEVFGQAVDNSLWNVGFGQAGKNKIINGDFSINQRNFTSTTTSNEYTFDRFRTSATDGTSTFSAQTFTPGSAPVAGYESTNFLRIASTGQTLASARTSIEQRIEDVRTFAGQTVALSFWAKASTGTPFITPEIAQIFGSGGSSAVTAIGATKTQITTNWVRYTVNVSIPSLTGKTIGTGSELRITFFTSAGSDLATRSASLGIQTATIDIWGIQIEAGNRATPFQTASGGSIPGEVAFCQRYYVRFGGDSNYQVFGYGTARSTQTFDPLITFPVTMRVAPTVLDFSTIGSLTNYSGGATSIATVSLNSVSASRNAATVACTSSGTPFTANSPYYLVANNSTSGYIGFSAEL